MDVLAYATSPLDFATAATDSPAAAPQEVLQGPANVKKAVQAAVEDIAEAGLTVTGPSALRTHPLARLISRTTTVARFSRSDDYTARQLVEFAQLAEGKAVVFRIGNGPFRNVDGENLQAPGREVKVPVQAQARSRRLRNLRMLHAAGFEFGEQLPLVPGEEEVVLRDPVEVLNRAYGLAVVCAMAEAVLRNDFTQFAAHYRHLGAFRDELTHRELSFLHDVAAAAGAKLFAPSAQVAPGLIQEAGALRAERHCVEALAWALQLIDVPSARLYSWDFEPTLWHGEEGAHEASARLLEPGYALLLATEGRLRDVSRILEALDLVQVLFRSAERAVLAEAGTGAGDGTGAGVGGGAGAGVGSGLAKGAGLELGLDIAPSVREEINLKARGWVRALGWLCLPGTVWGQAERVI